MRLELTQWLTHPIYHLAVFPVRLVLAIYLGEHGPPLLSFCMAICHVTHKNVLCSFHFNHRSNILKEAIENRVETSAKKTS